MFDQRPGAQTLLIPVRTFSNMVGFRDDSSVMGMILAASLDEMAQWGPHLSGWQLLCKTQATGASGQSEQHPSTWQTGAARPLGASTGMSQEHFPTHSRWWAMFQIFCTSWWGWRLATGAGQWRWVFPIQTRFVFFSSVHSHSPKLLASPWPRFLLFESRHVPSVR